MCVCVVVGGAMPQELIGLQFYNQRKSGEGRRSLFFLSRCHVSIIRSSSRLGGRVFCPYMVKLGPQIIVFFMHAESMSWGSLTYCAHWEAYGSHVTSVVLFGGMYHASTVRLCC